MRLSYLVIFAFFIAISSCNIWDNIYSQTKADTPIIISQSLNFQFDLRDNLKAKIDFNSDLSIVTLFIYIEMIVKLQLVKAQLDLTSLIVTISRLDNPQCQRYNIAAFKNVSLDQTKISGQRLFLLNIFFKFVGKKESNSKNQKYNIYKFQPFLFTVPPSAKLKQLQKQINSQTDDKIDLQDIDYSLDIPLFVHVNSVNGNIQKIYAGEKQETSVPFSTTSVVKTKTVCEAQIHSMSTADIKDIFQLVKEQQKKKN